MRSVVVLVAILSAAGCGAQKVRVETVTPDPFNPRVIEQLLARQQFGEAMSLLGPDARGGSSAERQQLLRKATELAQAYDRSTSDAIRDAAAREDWARAYRMLSEAQQNYPDGPRLREVSTEFETAPRRQERSAALQLQRKLDRAQWLLRERANLEELAQVEPGDALVATELERVSSEAQTLALQLSNLGIAALNERKLDLAERCLDAADRLHPNAENIRALERLDHVRNEINQERRARRLREEEERARAEAERRRMQLRAEEEHHQQEVRRLSAEFRAALGKSDLVRARAVLDQLRDFEPDRSQLAPLEQTYEVMQSERVEALLERGNALYSNGDVQAARDVWEEARRIDPEHLRVRERIQRAEQVLENLRDRPRRTQITN